MSGPTIDRAASSGDIWTPWEFIRAVEKKFGPIAVDLAASDESAKAPCYITEHTNSLTQDWACLLDGGLGWDNPPFTNIAPWAKYHLEQWRKGAKTLLLVPMGSQNWYWDYVEPYAQVYCVGRMVFDNCYNKQGELVTTPYPKDLILAHYDPNRHKRCPQRWRWQDGV